MEYNINSSFNSHISLIEELKKNSQSFIEESSKLIINTILSKNIDITIFLVGNYLGVNSDGTLIYFVFVVFWLLLKIYKLPI